MATQPEELAPGAEDPNADPNAQPQGGGDSGDGGQQPEDDTPEPVKELARKGGWVDRDQYTGPAENWKPADQFILDGREIQRNTAQELKALRQTVETIGRTNATIVEQTVEARVNALGAEYQKAVDDGDPNKAFKLSGEIHRLLSDKPAGPSGPTPSAQDFAQRNSGWFQKDPLATSLAIEVTNRLAGQGYDEKAQLDAAEREVRRQYPQLFSNQRNGFQKPQAGVNAPGSRGPQGNAGKPKGFADMPLEAQKVAAEMAGKPQLTNGDPEAFKKRYAENYWLEAGRKA